MNTIGSHFRVTTWGESHGKAVGAVVDGCPSNLEITRQEIQRELERRKPGQSKVTTSRKEEDIVEILSGVFEGKTLGTPISLKVENGDYDSSKYDGIQKRPRPGHADYCWKMKYGNFDYRGGGRASARETVGRVAAAAIAKKLLGEFGINCFAYTKGVGNILSDESLDHYMKGLTELIDSNSVRALDVEKAPLMEKEIIEAKKAGDSVGGVVECVAFNLPAGLGEPVFSKITAELGRALFSIPAVKSVEFGKGAKLAAMRGSQANDEFTYREGVVRTKTNNCGGVLGGLTNGMPLVVRCSFKPTASISQIQNTVDLERKADAEIQISGRHDPCVVPRGVVVVESMVALVLADMMIADSRIPKDLSRKE